MAVYFEVIVWTTLDPSLADLILEEIDHEQKLVSHRIYKEQCSLLKRDILAKDLRGVNRNLKEVIIVDSNPASYILQPDNAVPVVPFRGGNDRELMDLERFLVREVSGAADVRDVNRRKFKLNSYWQHDN
jgi:TFIIF-interacting CTD phosphatase-like protein